MNWSYRPSTETIAATTAQTITHSDEVLPRGGISRFMITNAGVNNSVGGTGVDRYRVKINSVPIWDITPPQLRAVLERFRSPLGAAIPATGDLRFSLPFDLFSGLVGGAPTGIPFNVTNSVEIVLNAANSSAGSSRIAWRRHTAEPAFMPRLIAQQMNIGATVTNGRFDVKLNDYLIGGFVLPIVGATGITRLRIVRQTPQGEEQIFHGAQEEILESQGYSSAESLTSTFAFLLDEPMNFPRGSYLEVDTGAGSAAADAIVPIELVPNPAAAKA